MEMSLQKRLWVYSVIGMLTTIVVLAFARLSYGVVLPFMREGLGISYKEAGLLGTVVSLGYVSMVVFAGILASKWGGKRTIVLGTLLVTFGFIGISISPAYYLTVMFMFLLGVGTAFTYTPLISLLVAWFPEKKGLVIGLTTSGVGIGILLTGVIVPYLSQSYPVIGWRLSWGLFALAGLLIVLSVLIFIKNPSSTASSPSAGEQSRPRDIYKNKEVINVSMIYGVIGVAYIIQMLFVMSFMIESGISVQVAGQLMALNGLLSIFTGPIWGHISDKIGRKTALILTMTFTFIAMVIPILFPTLLGFTVHILILSSTLTGLFTLVQASSMDQVKPADMPVAFSYATFYFAIGQFIGPMIAGWLIDDFGGFQQAFLFSSICLGVGLLLTFKVRSSDAPKVVAESNVSR
ncbi:MFS transporter [Bacillus sp. FJAT-45037]|uniref:MFS transporter n=1 Tax=Bacillus sp. FJAT-45037 TaxID=2011007 RepID=UPI000C2386B1|nr:MFS transporter [Bacillus sp. FJAT-45037]